MAAATKPRASIKRANASSWRSIPSPARSVTRSNGRGMQNRLNQEGPVSVKVWDPLVRVFHWSLATAVIIALMSDASRSLHKSAGYVAAGLVVLRVIWDFVGPQHARFADFVRL